MRINKSKTSGCITVLFSHYGHENAMKIIQKHLHDPKIDIFFMQNMLFKSVVKYDYKYVVIHPDSANTAQYQTRKRATLYCGIFTRCEIFTQSRCEIFTHFQVEE